MSATAENLHDATNDDLREQIAELQRENPGLSRAEIARQSGISSARLSRYLNGSYPGDNAAVEAQLQRWIDSYHRRELEAEALPPAPWYVETPTSERITAALRYAQLAGDITVVYGGAGLGKTRTIENYRAHNPNVWIATMTPATATVVPALEEIAEALGIQATGGAARIQRAIIRKLRGTMGLLIVDEAQHLGVQGLDAVRALHDATEVGLALCGNESVYARMTGGNRAAYLDRLFSRVGKRLYLRRVTHADVDTVINAWSVEAGECRTLLHQIAAKPGGLRDLTKTLRLASMFAAGRGEKLCCQDIREAWADRVEEA
ncbi:MAG TPA: AAA family ATPase [Gammaproteobacteria bacterium]|nr:AAA family ATPase [Gammaproteobacteria bacterium]